MKDKLSLDGYVILQSVGKKGFGIKGDGITDWRYFIYNSKEDARDFLRQIILNVKKEMRQGVRTANNLNPNESLDFYIQKVKVFIPTAEIKKRGWKFN